jgi:ABC-2 type transport system ATP-binding protein
MTCDRVAILSDGKILKVAAVADVLYGSIRCTEMLVENVALSGVQGLGLGSVSRRGSKILLTVPDDVDVNGAISRLMLAGAKVIAVTPLRQTLEDYFMGQVIGGAYVPVTRPAGSGSAVMSKHGGSI